MLLFIGSGKLSRNITKRDVHIIVRTLTENKEKLKFQVLIQVLVKENYFCLEVGTRASK